MSDCITWVGGRNAEGYGRLWVGGTHRGAHRLAWEDVYGAVPVGMVLHHVCQNKACVNVDHLEAVTRGEHSHIHGAMRTHCVRGHLLTPDATYVNPHGVRECKVCRRDRSREWWRANRGKVAA